MSDQRWENRMKALGLPADLRPGRPYRLPCIANTAEAFAKALDIPPKGADRKSLLDDIELDDLAPELYKEVLNDHFTGTAPIADADKLNQIWDQVRPVIFDVTTAPSVTVTADHPLIIDATVAEYGTVTLDGGYIQFKSACSFACTRLVRGTSAGHSVGGPLPGYDIQVTGTDGTNRSAGDTGPGGANGSDGTDGSTTCKHGGCGTDATNGKSGQPGQTGNAGQRGGDGESPKPVTIKIQSLETDISVLCRGGNGGKGGDGGDGGNGGKGGDGGDGDTCDAYTCDGANGGNGGNGGAGAGGGDGGNGGSAAGYHLVVVQYYSAGGNSVSTDSQPSDGGDTGVGGFGGRGGAGGSGGSHGGADGNSGARGATGTNGSPGNPGAKGTAETFLVTKESSPNF